MNKAKKQLLVLSLMTVLAMPSGAILARGGDDSGSGSGGSSGSVGSVDLRGNGTVEDNSVSNSATGGVDLRGNGTVEDNSVSASASTGVKLRGDGTVDDNSASGSTGVETLRGDGTVDDNPGIRQNRGAVQTTSASGTIKLRGDGTVDDNSLLRQGRGTDDLAGSATGTKLRGDGTIDDNSNSGFDDRGRGQDDSNSGTEDNRGRGRGEEHRSVISSFVENLLRISSSDKSGIGEQVREIANEQNSSKDSIERSIGEIESRSKIKTFLVGSDFKNIGQIRSEITKTDDRITRLNSLLTSASTSTASVAKTEIERLEIEQQKLRDFVTTNDDKFSLFGWVARMFNK